MKRVVLHTLVWLAVAWCLAPFAWQAITSLKTEAEINRVPTLYWPGHFYLGHYRALFERKPFARYLLNSLTVSTSATALCLAASSLAAYSFSRLKVRGTRIMLPALVTLSLFPAVVFVFPLYELVRLTHTANNPLALIVPYATFNLPFSILILSSFFRGISTEIEEAAKVDGFSRLRTLTRIILPLAAPALATTGILVFIFCWNEFLLALTFMTRDTSRTVTAGVASLGGATVHELPWGPLAAAVVVSTLPLILMVVLFQRRIVQGLTAGAVKG